jgi:flagellum-specific peptidoglycan hydrolase FlgJ
MTRQEFIKIIAPIAVKLWREGSPIFPSVRIAQAMLETGCVIHPWNNLVGFKVGGGKPNGFWKGQYVNLKTWEVYDGVRFDDVQANFRAYDTIEDCFKDQDSLFQWSRYDRVRAASTPQEQTDALYKCGYATDPQYAVKLNSFIAGFELRQYDKEASEPVLDKGVAQTIINTWISPSWHDAQRGYDVAEVEDNESVMAAYKEQMDYLHWLANELRKASGLPLE